MNTKILKATTKGQITLPAKWRRQFDTDQFIVNEKEGFLEIKPLKIDNSQKNTNEYTVFDAIRDNKGKGIDAEDLVKILENLD